MPQRFNSRVDSCGYAANEGLNEKKNYSTKNVFPIFSRQSRGRSMEQLTRLFYPHLFKSVFLRKEIEKKLVIVSSSGLLFLENHPHEQYHLIHFFYARTAC